MDGFRERYGSSALLHEVFYTNAGTARLRLKLERKIVYAAGQRKYQMGVNDVTGTR